jgi:putative oxidoreductase
MKFLTANAHWLLRIALASVLVYHGVLKFLNLEGFAQMLPISYLQVVLVALAETGGGLLVLVGGFRRDRISDLATRVGAALNIPVVIGAITIVHWGRWNFVPSETHPMGGFEFQAVLLLLMIYLVVTGNRGFAAADVKITQANQLPATASASAG